MINLRDQTANEDKPMFCSDAIVFWILDGPNDHAVELLQIPVFKFANDGL